MSTSGGAQPVVDITSGPAGAANPQLDTEYRQTAPYPHLLAQLVGSLEYRPGWEFRLRSLSRGNGCGGLTLCILVETPDSYDHSKIIRVMHYMPVPPATYNARSWQRWLFEQILLVERHESAEFFTIGGDKPYAPLHGPGNDPYLITELSTSTERATSYQGEISNDR